MFDVEILYLARMLGYRIREVGVRWQDDGDSRSNLATGTWKHARDLLDRVWALIQKLKPQDKQVILLYLEGMDSALIGEVTGFSPGNVATKIHRIKNLLSRKFHQGERSAK